MKCICGYEKKGDFENYKKYEPLPGDERIFSATLFDNLFVCPVCGTVKMELQHPLKICGKCNKTDGARYLTCPVMVRCTVTGKYHSENDECDCDKEDA